MDSQVVSIMGSLRKYAERSISLIGLDVLRELIVSTPVDTGHARANWVAKAGSPPAGPFGQRKRWNINVKAQLGGITALGRYTLSQGQVYISNFVDYIVKLNQGYSPQAPSEFVQMAMERGVAFALRRVTDFP